MTDTGNKEEIPPDLGNDDLSFSTSILSPFTPIPNSHMRPSPNFPLSPTHQHGPYQNFDNGAVGSETCSIWQQALSASKDDNWQLDPQNQQALIASVLQGPSYSAGEMSDIFRIEPSRQTERTFFPLLPKAPANGSNLPYAYFGTPSHGMRKDLATEANTTSPNLSHQPPPHSIAINQSQSLETRADVATPTALPSNPLNSPRWQQSLSYRQKVHRPPHVLPSTDPTISSIITYPEFWVTQITHALTNTVSVKDRPNSHAAKLFSPSTYDALLIESTARAIFLALLDRCIHGFRGPPSFDKSLGKGKESEADRMAGCRERLGNVITALRWNKRICKDVLWEDWKIRLLVNHPCCYDREKDLQMGSNEQRRVRMAGERERLKIMENRVRGLQSQGQGQGSVLAGDGLENLTGLQLGVAFDGNGHQAYGRVQTPGLKRHNAMMSKEEDEFGIKRQRIEK